jgi:anti-anti-sigma factor
MLLAGGKSSYLEVELRIHPARATLRCRGEIDVGNVDTLRQSLLAATGTEPSVLVVDLRDIDFLDSSTLEALLDADHRLAMAGGRLEVAVRCRARRLFYLVGLQRLLIEPSVGRMHPRLPWPSTSMPPAAER